MPDDDEMGTSAVNAPLSRRNPLARANRLEHVDRRWIGLSNVVTDLSAVMALDRFVVDDKLDAAKGFGGVRSTGLHEAQVSGGIEAAPHNLVHKTMGLQGDLGSPDTAARDPVFWLHHANVDRLWAKWTDPTRGRIPPVDDELWMTTKFAFVDEDGQDRVMTGADVLDTQFQLGYRYDDDPLRTDPLEFKTLVARGPLAPGAPQTAKGIVRARPAEPVVLARGGAVTLTARASEIVLASVSRAPLPPKGKSMAGSVGARLRVVLKDVVAGTRSPPYDVFLARDGGAPLQPGTNAVRIGGLDLFGGAGGAHGHHGGETLVFEASDAMAQLSRTPGFDLRNVRVAIVRRGFAKATGGEFVPDDPDPPRIGAIDLLQS